MRKPLAFLSIFLCFSCLPQTGEYVVKIDHATGTFTNTGPAIPGITWIYADDRAFIESAGTFIFPGATNPGLLSINVANDAIVGNPVLAAPTWYYNYNNTTGKLYGIQQDSPNNQKKLVSITPATGTFTQIGSPLPGSSLYSGAFSAFDQANNIFIFYDVTGLLYSLDTSTGNVTASPSLALTAGQSLRNLCFDNSGGKLYGLIYDSGSSLYFLAGFNPTTGAVSIIGSGSAFGGAGSSAIDETNQQFIYMYMDAGNASIITLNMANGGIIYNVTAPLTPGSNLFSLKYDNSQRKLYSIHWEAGSTGTDNTHSDKENPVSVYPNPGAGEFSIEADHDEVMTAEVADVTGRLVFSKENVRGKTSFNLSELSDGIYYVKVRNENKCNVFKVIKNSH